MDSLHVCSRKHTGGFGQREMKVRFRVGLVDSSLFSAFRNNCFFLIAAAIFN